MPVAKPNFYVVGAPKCGTTSLYRYLSEHPQIFLPKKKELHFFSRPELDRYSKGTGDRQVLQSLPRQLHEYESFYNGVSASEIAIGDISPSYFVHLGAAARIKSYNNEAKVIVCLRNPIDKAFSQYMHQVALGKEPLSFYQAIEAEEDRKNGRISGGIATAVFMRLQSENI